MLVSTQKVNLGLDLRTSGFYNHGYNQHSIYGLRHRSDTRRRGARAHFGGHWRINMIFEHCSL